VDIIRTAYYIGGLKLIKLIFAVLDVSLTMGLTRCYKTEGFFTFIMPMSRITSVKLLCTMVLTTAMTSVNNEAVYS